MTRAIPTANSFAELCNGCGLCCQKLHLNPLYRHLDRGNGTCLHFDEPTRRCSIYAQRPLLCRVDEMYDTYFAGAMTRTEFHRLNLAQCRQWQIEHSHT